jgi:hypothetical protein
MAHPDKAVLYYAQKYPQNAWAVLMAGGSCPTLKIADEQLQRDVVSMKPKKTEADGTYLLSGDNGMLVYKTSGSSYKPEGKNTYIIYKVDAKTGKTQKSGTLKAGGSLQGNGIYWLKKK